MSLHVSLVLGGYFLYQSIDRSLVTPELTKGRGVRVTSRNVAVEKSKPVPRPQESQVANKTVTPVTRESRTESRPPSPVRNEPRIVKVARVPTRPAYPQAPTRPSRPSSPQRTPARKPEPLPVSTPVTGPPQRWGREPAPEPEGEGGARSQITRRAMPLSQPEFNLTSRFPDLDSVQVKAKFEIAEDGSYEPTLLTGTGNPTADVVILGKLLEYKWRPALEKGVPVKDTRTLEISLEG